MKLLLYLLFFILLLGSVSGVCTVTLDKTDYVGGQTITAVMVCGANAEQNDPYSLTWYSGDSVLETDVGTTPALKNTPFFETYETTTVTTITRGAANLTGPQQEGDDTFTVTPPTVKILTMNDFTTTASDDILLGKTLGVEFEVKLNGSEEVSFALCTLAIEDSSDAPLISQELYSMDGHVHADFLLSAQTFNENQDYLAKIYCSCGVEDSSAACVTDVGTQASEVTGAGVGVFNIGRWLTSNTITNANSYTLGDEEVLVCANLTNNHSSRISVEIIYNYRCGMTNNNDATDRIIIAEHTELRGISGGATQNQCARLPIINYPTLQNRISRCYAATDVRVLSTNEIEAIVTYPTTSSTFNISSGSSVNKLEVSDMTGSLSITVFAIISAGFLVVLPFIKKSFSQNPITDLIIRRSCWVLASILMAFNSGIMATIAEAAGLDLTTEMFRYMWIFGWGGYVLAVLLVIGTLFEGLALYSNMVNMRRFD